jgi:hypothetical protein
MMRLVSKGTPPIKPDRYSENAEHHALLQNSNLDKREAMKTFESKYEISAYIRGQELDNYIMKLHSK